MTKTKSGFLKAGSIIAIVMAAIIAMFGLTFIAGRTMVDRDMVVEAVFEMKIEDVEVINNADGSISYKNPTTGARLESREVDDLIKVTKMILVTIGVYSIAMAIASLIIGVFNLVATSQEKAKTGFIITQLVLSIFTANILTFAFMIAALCLKDKKVEENVVESTVA